MTMAIPRPNRGRHDRTCSSHPCRREGLRPVPPGLRARLPVPCPSAAAAEPVIHRGHAISMFGEPAYPPGFSHFAYVNPDAPQDGGHAPRRHRHLRQLQPVRHQGQRRRGRRGGDADGASADEPFTQYGLIADEIVWPDDRSWVEFRLRPEARWHDGRPITADDVIFSLETLKTKGAPFYRFYYAAVGSVERDRAGPRPLRLQPGRQPRAAADRRADADPAQALLGEPRLRALDAGAAARERPLPHHRLRARPLRRDRAGRGLLGAGPAGERRPEQLRAHPLRVLSRRHHPAPGAEGRRRRPQAREPGEGLGARLRRAGGARRLAPEGGDPARAADGDAGLRLQHPPPGLRRPARSARRSATPSISSGPTACCSSASTAAPRATSPTPSSPPRASPTARSWRFWKSTGARCRSGCSARPTRRPSPTAAAGRGRTWRRRWRCWARRVGMFATWCCATTPPASRCASRSCWSARPSSGWCCRSCAT